MHLTPPGPLMIDLAGLEMTAAEAERLSHPLVGGVILFARNYQSRAQLTELCAAIHALRAPPLLIAIDHEGGRVQRCREGFTRLPPMRRLGDCWEQDPQAARAAAFDVGFVLAAELRACGVDLSFTPVLDLDWGRSTVIGDRAFHARPEVVIELAGALIAGLSAAGMRACGKHFPGHGWVTADSHLDLPVDERSMAELAPDLAPFRQLPLDAVMPAHVVYRCIDAQTAGFSRYWIDFLRHELQFTGVVFSDDLSMAGAAAVGNIVARANAAQQAGCDLLLVCNDPAAASQLLSEWTAPADTARAASAARAARIAALLPTQAAWSPEQLAALPAYQRGVARCAALLEGVPQGIGVARCAG